MIIKVTGEVSNHQIGSKDFCAKNKKSSLELLHIIIIIKIK